MAKFGWIVILFLCSSWAFALPEYRIDMQQKLQSYPTSKFSFQTASISTITTLLAHQTGIQFELDPQIDNKKEIAIFLQNSNFLQFLQYGLDKLDLDYQVIAPNRIKIIPKVMDTEQLIKQKALQLWSDHRILALSVGQCATKAEQTLQQLGLTQIVRQQNFVYGNAQAQRVAVKCVPLDKQTFMYVAVAGEQRERVEKLRNQIIQMMQAQK